ncbi:phosphodiester glycosidase family protein [Nonomuraea sp. MCN248]|uniref:Phosphodiester glycosidase family protein n=1 Tax=Nonomuraea corallina TaxID=2989783 RepID=A0ABT4SBA0_9ACTN|nr:phosphodiester glycosidase family protein [Nonomuraea corallina]MDA0634492.1 phosphodiester glycosidase family protein [Nonomuraea corallina]
MQTLRSLAVVALVLTSAAPAQADPVPPVEDAPAASSYPPPSTLVAASATGDRLDTAKKTRPVAPGITLTSFDRLDPLGWLRADALTAELGGGTSADYVFSGEVSKTEPLSGPARRSRAVAAVNGDFFDINNSGAAQGIGVQTGELVQSPMAGHDNAVAISGDGVGRVLKMHFEGTATPESGSPVTLTQFNQRVQRDGVGLFTPLWGSYTRARAVEGASAVTEVELKDGVVAAVRQAAGDGPIPAGTSILLGRDAGAAALAGLRAGDKVEIAYRPKASDGKDVKAAVGGNWVLVKDGRAQHSTDQSAHPRTAVGFSADGKKMILLTVDGRQADSRGVTLDELAAMMVELGAADALNLDGGGSSTMLAREPGQAEPQIENSPSDGGERHVPNGLALYAAEGSGELKGFWVETAVDPARAPGAAPVGGGRPERVFPGLTRRLTAAGYDETYGPAAGTPVWRSTPAVHGLVRGGTFHALVPGVTTVTASRGKAEGALELTVLQPLKRLGVTSDRVGLSGADDTATFGVVGYDRNGNTAPIEPSDLTLDYDRALLDVTANEHGSFTVKARKDTGSGLVTARVGKIVTALPVTVGFEDRPVADFEDAASWTFAAARATGSLSAAPGQNGGGLKLSYDFTQSTATRAAYANPPGQLVVGGQPQAFGMWIHSTGKGEWPSLEFYDALGQAQILRGPYLTWTGWRFVEFAVPPGVSYPLQLRRFYVAETRADASYTNEILVDGLVAKVAPSIESPQPEKVADPVVRPDVADLPWRFAVMSDAQFVARDPDSDLVRGARRTLREIKAADPDFLVVNGDLVDEASPEDFALAKRILDEELGDDLKYHYIPGNHEVMGGKIDNFRAVFGDTYRTFDHKGTRFITLDTSRLNLRGGGFEQIELLRTELDRAAGDRSVGSVAVLFHVPPRDPTPGKGSQLGDRKEAALVEGWLADFQRDTGKGAAFIGAHVGTFHASRVDAVPYVINGNSAKNPATPAGDGGFTGWSLWGVDPVTEKEAEHVRRNWFADAPEWIGAQLRPHVDELTLTAPATVAAGSPATVTATVRQGARDVPVAYPVSARWSGSPNLHIGPRAGARRHHVAVLDPGTGTLTALREGRVTVAVTVNGVTRQAAVAVAARAAA